MPVWIWIGTRMTKWATCSWYCFLDVLAVVVNTSDAFKVNNCRTCCRHCGGGNYCIQGVGCWSSSAVPQTESSVATAAPIQASGQSSITLQTYYYRVRSGPAASHWRLTVELCVGSQQGHVRAVFGWGGGDKDHLTWFDLSHNLL